MTAASLLQPSRFFSADKVLLLLLLIVSMGALQAQNKKLAKGISHYEYQEFSEAIPWFKKALEEDNQLYTAVKLTANSYRKIRDYESAELYYILAVNSDSSVAEDHLYYGQVLKANGKLAAAKQQFIKFSELSENSFLGNIMIQSIDEIGAWEEVPKEFKVQPGSGINTEESEFGLLLFRDKVYIASNRAESFYSNESSSYTGGAFMSIYDADSSALINDETADFKLANGLINTKYHDGPLTISPDEDRAIITRISNEMRGKNFINRMKLFEGKYEKGKWREFIPLPFNSDEYSVGHAVFADSGQVIYFASDMPGGYGGMDLYKSQRDGEGWTEPMNLGKVINTPGNEVFPYTRNDILYYSSDGFPGYGGLDIFYSVLENESWQAPINMKQPINSNRDDFSIYFLTDSTGYYASNRAGGKGQDDLYSFIKTPPQIKVKVHAVLEYEGLPMEGTKVILINQQDSVVQIAYTDKDGRLIFDKLPYNQDFLIKVEATDGSTLEEGRLFLTDEDGNKLRLLGAIRDGTYTFKSLPVEEVKLAMEELSEPEEINQFIFAGKVFKKLPGDGGNGVMVYLVNDAGEIVDSLLTDEFGNFNFTTLSSDEVYLIQLAEEDPDLKIALTNEQGRIYSLPNRGLKGFVLNKEVDASRSPLKATNEGYTSLIARIEHQGTPIQFTTVKIYDQDNNLIATLISNENGEFQYNKLQFDDIYYVDLVDLEEDIKFETLLYLTDQQGDPLYLINQLKDGRYQFNSLPFEEYALQRDEKLLFIPEVVNIAGQIYKKLPGDFDDGLLVYVLNEEGDIIDSVITDVRGRFTFEKLRSDESYSFKLANSEEDFNLALLDENNVIIDKAVLNNEGNFTYTKLTHQIAQFEELTVQEVEMLQDEYSQQVFGQVFQKLPGDFGDSLKVFIYDDEGNFLGTAYTDIEGKFKFDKLKSDETFFFKLENEDDNFQLLTFDEEKNVIDRIIKNEKGQFRYAKLDLQHHEIFLEEASDMQVLYYDDKKIDLTKFTVNYRFDRTILEATEKHKLDELIKAIKGKNLKIQVISHTDNRGSHAYNKSLSQARTKYVIEYLASQGLDENQFVANFYGDLRPIIDCEKYNCDNDDHRLNRRTEFKFLDMGLEKTHRE